MPLQVSDTSNPKFNHSKVFSFRPVTKEALRYLAEGQILVEVWAVQVSTKTCPKHLHQSKIRIIIAKWINLAHNRLFKNETCMPTSISMQMPIMRDKRDRRNTAALITADALSRSMVSAANKSALQCQSGYIGIVSVACSNRKVIDVDRVKAGVEADVLRKRTDKIESKVRH